MHHGTARARDPLVLVSGNIWIIIEMVLDVEAGRRAPENDVGHHENIVALRCQTMIYRKVIC
jgi:hypothetical protein